MLRYIQYRLLQYRLLVLRRKLIARDLAALGPGWCYLLLLLSLFSNMLGKTHTQGKSVALTIFSVFIQNWHRTSPARFNASMRIVFPDISVQFKKVVVRE